MTSTCKEDCQQQKTAGQPSHLTYRPDIDGLRAVAVILVVGFHAFPKYIKGGFIGVDIFFVISGFLITSLILQDLQKQRFSFADFYSRRIRRIFPALFTVLAAVLAFGWFALLPDEYRQLGKHIAGGAGFISNLILWKESGYFDIASELKPLLHLWSLGIEEQYYIVWPLLLYLLWKKRYNLLTATVLLLLLSFGLNLALYKKNPVADFYLPGSRFWELLAGATLAHLTLYPIKRTWITTFRAKRDQLLNNLIYADQEQKKQKTLWANLLSILGILLIALAAYRLTKDHPFPGKWAVLPVLGAVFLIVAGPEAWINKNILSRKPLVWVGLISYPLYLWHWPLLSFARIIEGETPSSLIRGGLVLLSFVLAAITYLLIERPMRFGEYKKVKVAGLAVAVAIVGLAGLYVKNHKGLPKRASVVAYEKAVQQLGDPVLREVKNKAGVEYVGKEIAKSLFFCRYSGTDFAQTVAVVGDSHAHSAYHGIASLGKEMGFNTVLLGASVGNMRTLLLRGEDSKIIDILLEKPDIKLVFLVFRMPKYIKGKDRPDNWFQTARKNGGAAVFFRKKLQNMLDRLKSAGKEVIIVNDNPTLPADPRDYAKRPSFFARKERLLPVLLQRDTLEQQKEVLALLSMVKGATVVSPVDVFCDSHKCRVFDEKGWFLYYDDNHLSEAGSEFQARQLFLPYLKKMAEKEKTGAMGRK